MTVTTDKLLGQGVVPPLRRAGGDFVFAAGVEDVRGSLTQLLMTRRGELRWRPDFGINLDPFRHRNMDDTLFDEIAAELRANIARYEPRVEIQQLEVRTLEEGSSKLMVRVVWSVVVRSSRGNVTLADPQVTETQI